MQLAPRVWRDLSPEEQEAAKANGWREETTWEIPVLKDNEEHDIH